MVPLIAAQLFKRLGEPSECELSLPDLREELPSVKDVVSKMGEKTVNENLSKISDVESQKEEPKLKANLFPMGKFQDELLLKMS